MCSKSLGLVVLIFLFIVCCWGIVVPATAQEIHFRFNPPGRLSDVCINLQEHANNRYGCTWQTDTCKRSENKSYD